MSLLEKASLVVTPNAYKASKLYSVIPNTTLGDMDVVRATTATRVNSAGLIESVANNVPRIDYTNGSCPSILVEPQRTNLILYSEQFDNADWMKVSATITANTTTSPSGVSNADTLVITSGGYLLKQILSYSAVTGQKVTASIFTKNQITDFLQFGGATPAGTDLYSIETISNGWYRHKVTRTFTTTAVATLQFIIYDRVGTHFIWGGQVETGAYATSYIPTVASSVTRNADVISKTGISSLIGQTEGTIFIDAIYPQNIIGNFIGISNGTTSQRLIFGSESGLFRIFGTYGSPVITMSINTRNKIALAYSPTNLKVYLNGVLFNTYIGVPPTSPSAFSFTNGDLLNQNLIAKCFSAQLYKTALSNTECINLTTL